jgi:hypothetical protein
MRERARGRATWGRRPRLETERATAHDSSHAHLPLGSTHSRIGLVALAGLEPWEGVDRTSANSSTSGSPSRPVWATVGGYNAGSIADSNVISTDGVSI